MIVEDKRKFFRYRCNSSCELKFLNEVYTCTLVDFSDGAGIIINNIPGLKSGSIVSLTVSEPEIELTGKVVWIKEKTGGLRAGIRRTDNIRGSLRDYPVSAVMFGLQRGMKTGVLEIRDGLIVKKLFVENGNMVFASSSDKADRFGVLLLKEGKITLEQYVDSTNELKQKGQRLGKLLVESGAITPKDLFNVVRHHIEEVILNLFTILHGKFEFFEGPLTSREVITLRISAANLIYRGIKRINDFEYVEKMCPSLDDVFAVNPSPLNVFQDFDLDLSYKVVLSLVNGNDSLREIIAKSASSASSDFETLKAIFTLISMGLIYVKKKDGDAVEMPDSAGISEEESVTDEYEEKLSEEEPDMTGEEAEPEPEDSVWERAGEMTVEVEEQDKAGAADVISSESFYVEEGRVRAEGDGIRPVDLFDRPAPQETAPEPGGTFDEDVVYENDIDSAEDEKDSAEFPGPEPGLSDEEGSQEEEQTDEVTAEKSTAKRLPLKFRKDRIPATLSTLTSGRSKERRTGISTGTDIGDNAPAKSSLSRYLVYFLAIILSVAVVILFQRGKISNYTADRQIMSNVQTYAAFPTFHEEAIDRLTGMKTAFSPPVFRDDAFKILSGD